MCAGVPILANNKRAVYGKKTNSHTTTASKLKLKEDNYRKFEYLWWEKRLIQVHYDRVASDILAKIDEKKATGYARTLVRTHFNTQVKLARWLKDVPEEWDKLLDPKFTRLAKMVNPKIGFYVKRIAKFRTDDIEKYNPYQATKLPTIKQLTLFPLDQVGDQVRYQVWNQVRYQVWYQVWNQVWNQVGDQVGDQVRYQVWNQVWNQVGDQVWNQVGDQVRNQIRTNSYYQMAKIFNLKLDHWFTEFIKLGVIVVIIDDKIKVFGRKGKYLGEYDKKEVINKTGDEQQT